MSHWLIYTHANSAAQAALEEIRSVDPAVGSPRRLSDEVTLVETNQDWQALSAGLRQAPPIFVRHVCPAFDKIALLGTAQDLDTLGQSVEAFVPFLDRKISFSVQTRVLGERVAPYGRFEINNALAEVLQEKGFSVDVRAPAQVISVVVTDTTAWLGFSKAEDNLSDWAGGEHRFKTEPDQVSRAEFKLLEAFSVFRLQLPPRGFALDLGAAPGGWTRVLAMRGLSVIAIDPAELHPAVKALPRVTHLQKTFQEALPLRQMFDVIANDMRTDAADSVRMVGLLARNLKPGGFGVMTLKLPEFGGAMVTRQSLVELARHYVILGARQLFHNRNEVTVVFRGK